MIGKMIGAAVGARVAEKARGGIGGTGGALVGALAVPLLRRLGPVGLITVALGGYAASRMSGKR
ncbi:hypothetical protein [Croceibacterium ferulae]|uniref:hypothetical protein n=1 Tax=Croceibacterium ferulae TaxID=1854641 RepID=UPI000EB328F4|nr:hypothetical protein [Croceibacterium ferulae]